MRSARAILFAFTAWHSVAAASSASSSCADVIPVRAAAALVEAGYFDKAEKKLDTYLDTGPGGDEITCVTAALTAARQSRFDQALDRVRALAETGQYDAARASLKKLLQDGSVPASAIAVPADLGYLIGGEIDWWRGAKAKLVSLGLPLLEIAAVLLALLILYRRLTAPFRSKPRVSIEAFRVRGFKTEQSGEQFCKSILNAMAAMQAGVRDRIDLMSASVDADAVPTDITAVIPGPTEVWYSPVAWVKALPALFDWLLRPTVLLLEGELHHTPERGIGATIRLTDGGRVVGSDVLWFQNFDAKREPSKADESVRILQLANYIAAWVVFLVNERHGFDGRLGGTNSWQAHIFMNAGAQAVREGRRLAARNLYQRALSCDPEYRSPKVNLGNRLMATEPELATYYLERARKEALAERDCDLHATLYGATYNLVVIKALAATKPMNENGDPPDSASAAEAVVLAQELIGRASGARRRIRDSVWLSNSMRDLDPYLDRMQRAMRPIAAAMLAIEDFEKGLAMLEQHADEGSTVALELINIACSYAVMAGLALLADDQETLEACLDETLRFLRACFHVSGQYLDTALTNPILGIVRKRRSEAFRKLHAAFNSQAADPPPPTLPLSTFAAIGMANAKALAEHSIRTAPDLLLKARTAKQRGELARLMDTDPIVVLDWAEAADLSRIVALNAIGINLLRLAQVTSLESLAGQSPGPLTRRLNSYAQSMGVEAPERATVERWQSSAATNTLPTLE